MSGHLQPNPNEPRQPYPDVTRGHNPYELPSGRQGRRRRGPSAPLPSWLGKKFLEQHERLTWVRGPRWNSPVEWLMTHPLLFVLAVIVSLLMVGAAAVLAGDLRHVSPLIGMMVFVMPLGSIVVLGISNAYFTRLVITDRKVFISQGHEICRVWKMDQLPPSMVRHTQTETGEEVQSVDLERIKDMLGGGDDGYVDAKTIKKFGKQLDQFRELD